MAHERTHDVPAPLRLSLEATCNPDDAIDVDPLVGRARLYSEATARILAALRPMVEGCSDVRVLEALSCLAGVRELVALSIRRAVEDDRLAAEAASLTLASCARRDAVASAAVALFVIDESTRAWRILMEPGRALANGVPARLAAMLTELEGSVQARYPGVKPLRRGHARADAT